MTNTLNDVRFVVAHSLGSLSLGGGVAGSTTIGLTRRNITGVGDITEHS